MVWNSSTRRQITATSDVSVDDAIARALSIAREGYKEPDWFGVLAARGFISNGRVTHYQVTLDLGYETSNPTHDGICSNESISSALAEAPSIVMRLTRSRHGFN